MSSPNSLINLTGFTDGIASDEVGINIAEFKASIEPEYQKFVPGKYGPARGAVVGPMKLEVSLSGEISGNTGVMAAVIGTAATLANSTAYFGAPTTGKYLAKAEIELGREEGKLASVHIEFWARAGIP